MSGTLPSRTRYNINRPFLVSWLARAPASHEARRHYQKIQTILLSPVLNRVLEHNLFSLTGKIVARLDRAKLGDFDCFVLGNLLISSYPGTVVVPDFGFYGRKHHVSLIRQNRLVAGLNFLDESLLKYNLLLIKDRVASRCLPSDAATLAEFKGLIPGTDGFSTFVKFAVEGTFS